MIRLAPFLVLLASCVSVPRAAELRVYRGAIHVHSRYSHDSKGTYEEILAAAKKVGVDFVIMTDHPPDDDPGLPLREGWRGLHDGVLFIQGAELGRGILALGVTEPILSKGRQERIDEIHAKGGLAFLTHMEEIDHWSFSGFDGVEIFNIHTGFKELAKNPAKLGRILKGYRNDPDAAWLNLAVPQEELLRKWDGFNRERPVVGIAGNDAHQNTLGLDPYERSLGFVSTRVRAAELSEKAILEGIRRGDCFVVLDAVAPAPEGPILRQTGSATYEVRVAGDVRPFHDGAKAGNYAAPVWHPTAPGSHRLEIWRRRGDRLHPWLYTNPLRR